jgi:hypothetical protein
MPTETPRSQRPSRGGEREEHVKGGHVLAISQPAVSKSIADMECALTRPDSPGHRANVLWPRVNQKERRGIGGNSQSQPAGLSAERSSFSQEGVCHWKLRRASSQVLHAALGLGPLLLALPRVFAFPLQPSPSN